MKNIFKFIIIGTTLSSFLTACTKDYIDPISAVSPGSDALAPTVEIVSPSADIQYPAATDAANFDFKFNVNDDIEISKVDISLNGTLLKSYTSFVDYRGISGTYTYPDLGVGSHTFQVVATDASGKSTTQSFTFNITKYNKLIASETLYVPFGAGGDYKDLINFVSPTVTGSPSTTSATGGHNGAAYQGAADAYLSFPISGLYSSSDGVSFSFWYKVNASPDRSGIITINDNANNSDENRNGGLRLFREGSATSQTIKINVGTGAGESWNDGGSITVAGGAWVHVAVTVSPTESKIYFDGVLQRTSTFSGFDFSSSSTVTLGSGAPSFTYWSHLSDLSLYDEFRVFNKVLTAADIQLLMQ